MLQISNFHALSFFFFLPLLQNLYAFQVVYLADSNGYVPLNSLRGPPGAIAPQLYAGSTGGGAELESWRPEVWDRDYNRRYRFNNTRVQRKGISIVIEK